MIQVSIIIITWNNIAVTEKCLQWLSKKFPSDAELIIVDNDSKENIKDLLDEYKNILPLKAYYNTENRGFAKAVNQGISYSNPLSDIVLLNNDIFINDDEWLIKLQKAAYSESDIGIVGCRIIGEDEDKFLHAGIYMPCNSFWAVEIGGGELNIGQYKYSKDCLAITFAICYIKRELINKIGLLDDSYFAYFEDVDYCLKARMNNYRVKYLGDLTVIHMQGASTNSDKAFFNKIYRQSQEIFKQRWENTEIFNYNYGVVWHSIANISIGYSISSRFIIKELDKNKIDVRYKYIYGKDTVFPLIEPLSYDPILKTIQSKPLKNYPLQVSYSQGDLFYKNFGKYKVGFTMLEADGLPSEWVKQCNQMDEVWVPSSFNKDSFAKAGVKVPIYVMPLGVDVDHFNPEINPRRLSAKFSFLSVFEWSERKGQELLIRAFKEEFTYLDDAVLIMKVFNPDIRNNIELELANLGVRADDENIIILLGADVPYYQLGSLYRGADCFVLPTRGEGWGMPIMEAMACGIPVIATNWSAQCDFLNDGNAYLLNVKKLVPAITKSPYYKNLNWAEPDYEHLRYLLKYVYENREEAKKKAMRASDFIINNYSWDTVIQKMMGRIRRIYEQL